MPLKKVLTFNRKEDFYMDIKVSNPVRKPPGGELWRPAWRLTLPVLSQERQPECDSENIGAYNITGVEKAAEYNETTKPKISVTFELDRSGLLVVTKAEAKTESWTEEQVVKKKNNTEAANETSADEEKEGEDDAEKKEEDAGSEEESKEEESKEEESKEEASEGDEAADGEGEEDGEEKEAEEEVEYETKLVKKVHRVPLDWNFTALDMTPMTAKHTKASKKVMKEIQKRMDDIAALNKIKNDVEAHVFQTRDAFEYNEELKQVMSDEEMDTIRASLSEVEEWLWEDHELQEYKDKLKVLQKDMKPAMTRKAELEERPKAVATAKEQIASIRAYLLNETAMADVHPNDTAVIEAATTELETWLTDAEATQEGKALTETPAFLAADVVEKAGEHRNTVSEALRPKVKPKSKKKKDGPVETKKEKEARLKAEKTRKTANKRLKELTKLQEQLEAECGVAESCKPEDAGKDGEEFFCEFTPGDADSCGEGCVYTAPKEPTAPKKEEAAEEEEAAAAEEKKEEEEEEGSDEKKEDESAEGSDEDKSEEKEKKDEGDTCEMLPEQVKAAAKKWEKAEAKATKADEDYTKEKETVLANRCGHATGCAASVWATQPHDVVLLAEKRGWLGKPGRRRRRPRRQRCGGSAPCFSLAFETRRFCAGGCEGCGGRGGRGGGGR